MMIEKQQVYMKYWEAEEISHNWFIMRSSTAYVVQLPKLYFSFGKKLFTDSDRLLETHL